MEPISIHNFTTGIIPRFAWALCGLYALDRSWKLACIARFFRRPAAPDPARWPVVSLIQPITEGASGLPHNLTTRALLNYPGTVQHLLVIDAQDAATEATCRAFLEAWPDLDAQLIPIRTDPARKASKVEKMQAGMAVATGDVLCFIDDDIAPRPDNLTIFVRHLYLPGAGGVFGLPCYTNWEDVGSSLMSLFVNANALPSYIPLTFLTDPYTITGHFYALRREIIEAFGGFHGLEKFISEDHEVARRIRTLGLRIVQTPAIYDANNKLPTISAFNRQILRWFVFTGRILWPLTTAKERALSTLGSLGHTFPPLLLGMSLLFPSWQTWGALSIALCLTALSLHICDVCYVHRRTPLRRWPLLLFTSLITPLQAIWTMLRGREVVWRGQRIRVFEDGTYEVLP